MPHQPSSSLFLHTGGHCMFSDDHTGTLLAQSCSVPTETPPQSWQRPQREQHGHTPPTSVPSTGPPLASSGLLVAVCVLTSHFSSPGPTPGPSPLLPSFRLSHHLRAPGHRVGTGTTTKMTGTCFLSSGSLRSIAEHVSPRERRGGRRRRWGVGTLYGEELKGGVELGEMGKGEPSSRKD